MEQIVNYKVSGIEWFLLSLIDFLEYDSKWRVNNYQLKANINVSLVAYKKLSTSEEERN